MTAVAGSITIVAEKKDMPGRLGNRQDIGIVRLRIGIAMSHHLPPPRVLFEGNSPSHLTAG
ncbi:MAG: hypothetical protein AAF664_18150 [Planctomycetota bacterium]